MLALTAVLFACACEPGHQPDEPPTPEDTTRATILSGGETTVFDTSHNAYSLPATNLSIKRRDRFFIGNAFFKQPWVSAPASTAARDGLGPLFNSNACQGCHIKDGRGHPPSDENEPFISALIKLGIFDSAQPDRLLAEPNYGSQFQPQAIHGITPEGHAYFEYRNIDGQFADGEEYSLQAPVLKFRELGYGPLHPDLRTSVRVAPPMIGLGLLEAIPEAEILALTDPADKDGDGISGRANWAMDLASDTERLGRFGWKAAQPTVAQQSLVAFSHDMGITSSRFPEPACQPTQTACLQAPNGGSPELQKEIEAAVMFYARTLAVPARRDVNDAEVQQGERLFNAIGCTGCHTPSFVTADDAIEPELAGQTIYPYTDLLLHDMGDGLADQFHENQANGNEWRTPPLWGIGLLETVNGHTRLLHDGRARSLEEAILWHGGEAQNALEAYVNMNAGQRGLLIRFLESL